MGLLVIRKRPVVASKNTALTLSITFGQKTPVKYGGYVFGADTTTSPTTPVISGGNASWFQILLITATTNNTGKYALAPSTSGVSASLGTAGVSYDLMITEQGGLGRVFTVTVTPEANTAHAAPHDSTGVGEETSAASQVTMLLSSSNIVCGDTIKLRNGIYLPESNTARWQKTTSASAFTGWSGTWNAATGDFDSANWVTLTSDNAYQAIIQKGNLENKSTVVSADARNWYLRLYKLRFANSTLQTTLLALTSTTSPNSATGGVGYSHLKIEECQFQGNANSGLPLAVTSVSGNGSVVTIITDKPHQLVAGAGFTISNTTNYNGSYAAASIGDAYTITAVSANTGAAETGQFAAAYGTDVGTAILQVGSAGTFNKLVIKNNAVSDCYDGINLNAQDYTIEGNEISRIWNDAIKQSGLSERWRVSWNLIYDKFYGDGGLHGDFVQWSYSGVSTTREGGVVLGNIMLRGIDSPVYNGSQDSRSDGQGIFLDDGNSGATVTGVDVRGNFYLGGFVNGIGLFGVTNAVIKYNTCVSALDPSASAGAGRISIGDSTNGAASVGGTIQYNTAYSLVGATATISDNYAHSNSTTNLQAAFTAPITNGDVSAIRAIATAVSAYSMKTSGPLDNTINYGAVGTGYVDYVSRTTGFPN